MADFRIWGRIEHIGPQQFFVVVSAVPDLPQSGLIGVDLESQTLSSRAEATDARAVLMRAMGERIRARGDRVVDVEEE